MRKNTALSLIRDGKVALGTWLQLHSYQASRMLAAQGLFEWLLVDFEHTPVDRSTAAAILGAISDVSGGPRDAPRPRVGGVGRPDQARTRRGRARHHRPDGQGRRRGPGGGPFTPGSRPTVNAARAASRPTSGSGSRARSISSG